jgi:type I restriction enzyme S subunit
MSQKLLPFLEMCDIQGGTQPPKSEFIYKPKAGYVRLLQIQDFNSEEKAVYVPDQGNLKKCCEEDILVGRYGASVGRILTGKSGAYNVAIVKTIPDPERLDKRYLFHFLNSPYFQNFILNVGSRAAQAGFNKHDLERLNIPLPPMTDQKRIAAILDKADAIRRKRQQTTQLVDEFLRSVFLDMFGDPVTNPKGYNRPPLGDLVEIISGGTPSRADKRLWNGMFPWVSPKDMKSITISNSIEKISENAFSEASLKRIPKKSVLIVIRGMILAHTIPIGITAKEVAINQDIKALKPRSSLLPEFLLWSLLVQHNFILLKVSTAAHGTKRFDTADLKQIKILLPSIELQNRFIDIVYKFSKINDQIAFSLEETENLFHSLSQRAFRGEL